MGIPEQEGYPFCSEHCKVLYLVNHGYGKSAIHQQYDEYLQELLEKEIREADEYDYIQKKMDT